MENMSVDNREQASNSHHREEERKYYAEDLIDELKLFEVKEIKTGTINCNNSLITIDNQEIDLQNIKLETILKLNFDDFDDDDEDNNNDDENYFLETKAEENKNWTKLSKDLKNINSHFLNFLGHSITSKQLGNNYQSIPQKLIIFVDKNFPLDRRGVKFSSSSEEKSPRDVFREKKEKKEEKIIKFGENEFSFRPEGKLTREEKINEEEAKKVEKIFKFGENNFSLPSGEETKEKSEREEEINKFLHRGNKFSFSSEEQMTRDEENGGKMQKEEKMEQEKIQKEEKMEQEKIQKEEKMEQEKIKEGEKIQKEEKMKQEKKIQKEDEEEEDSPKILIVTCPTQCTGGEIKFPQLKKIFNPNSLPNKSLNFLLFDAKIIHQITKIVSGSRILLIYKLTPTKITFDSMESQISTDTRKLKAMLKSITEQNVLIPITKRNSLKKLCDNLKLNYQQVYSAKETPKIVYGELDRNEMEFYYRGWEECDVDFYSLIRTSSRFAIGKIINYSRPEIINDILVRYRKYGTGPEESNYEVDYYSFLLINPCAMENCDSDPSEPDPSESDFTESDDRSELEEEIENEVN